MKYLKKLSIGLLLAFTLIATSVASVHGDMSSLLIPAAEAQGTAATPAATTPPATTTAAKTTFTGYTEADKLKLTITNQIIDISKTALAFTIPLTAIAGNLLSNEWVTGQWGGFQDIIYTLWIYIRNVINLLFIALLLLATFGHIIGLSDDKKSVLGKSALPKFILAVILVNFSYFGAKVILDGANLLTTAAFSLPTQVNKIDLLPTTTNFNAFIYKTTLKQNEKPTASTTPAATPTPGAAGTTAGTTGSTTTAPATTTSSKDQWNCVRRAYYMNFKNSKERELEATAEQTRTETSLSQYAKDRNIRNARDEDNIIVPVTTYGQAQLDKGGAWKWEYMGFRTINENADFKDFDLTSFEGPDKRKEYQETLEKMKLSPSLNCIVSSDQLFNAKNALYVFTFGLLRLPEIQRSIPTDSSITDIALSTLIGIWIVIMYFLIVIALVIALAFRSVMLWALMILSPAWVLELIPMVKVDDKNLKKYISIQSYISLALMPAYVGIVLSIGYIFLFALKNYLGSAPGFINNAIPLGFTTLYFQKNALVSGYASIGEVIVALLTLALLWSVVFAALKHGDITGVLSKVMDGIQKFGSSIPGKLPIIPIKAPGEDRNMTLGEAKDALGQKLASFGDDGKSFGKMPASTSPLSELQQASTNKDISSALEKVARNSDSLESFMKDSIVKAKAKQSGIDPRAAYHQAKNITTFVTFPTVPTNAAANNMTINYSGTNYALNRASTQTWSNTKDLKDMLTAAKVPSGKIDDIASYLRDHSEAKSLFK